MSNQKKNSYFLLALKSLPFCSGKIYKWRFQNVLSRTEHIFCTVEDQHGISRKTFIQSCEYTRIQPLYQCYMRIQKSRQDLNFTQKSISCVNQFREFVRWLWSMINFQLHSWRKLRPSPKSLKFAAHLYKTSCSKRSDWFWLWNRFSKRNNSHVVAADTVHRTNGNSGSPKQTIWTHMNHKTASWSTI